MNFDFDGFGRHLEKMVRARVQDSIRDKLSELRCPIHPDSRVTAIPDGLERFQIEATSCCDTFRNIIEAALPGLGIQKREEPMATPTQSDPKTPRAFLSHSHADKEAIVHPLDRLLREVEGVATWLDDRDMAAGANLMDAIFAQGIGESDAVIVALTPHSIESKWVHEELSVAFVRKINNQVKVLIPVIYDISDDQVPPALAATNWIKLSEISDAALADCAHRIGVALHGAMPAPVAPPPAYAGVAIHGLPNLTANDERLFVGLCRIHLGRARYRPAVGFDEIAAFAESIEISHDDVIESIHALESHHYLSKLHWEMGNPDPYAVEISDFGLEGYLERYDPETYRQATIAFYSDIVNRDGHSMYSISQATGVPDPLAHLIVDRIESHDLAHVSWHSNGASIMAKPTMKRALERLG